MKNKETYQIEISASPEVVWNAVVDPRKYQVWTYAFNKDSRIRGGWNQGDKIQFYGSDEETGEIHGMSSKIVESKKYEFISIQHLGIIKNDVEYFDTEEVKKWAPAFENYTFTKTENGGTLFKAEVDLDEEYAEMFAEMWTEALKLLKLLCESMFQVQVLVSASVKDVWTKFTTPESVMNWNFASPDWECPKAVNDLTNEGKFSYTMAAKDGSVSFDFSGQYLHIMPHQRIVYKMDDNRLAYVFFEEVDGQILVTEIVQAETENPIEMQTQGWQAILDNFKKFAES